MMLQSVTIAALLSGACSASLYGQSPLNHSCVLGMLLLQEEIPFVEPAL
jgi:hypothetical protein